MSDEEIFEKWWKVYSPPGTFDKAQCKVAFIAGMIIQRVEAAQHRVQPTLLESRDLNLFCPLCGGQFDIELPASQSG